jgi:hypothetical protein
MSNTEPSASFFVLIQMHMMQAFFACGDLEDPSGKKGERNLDLAKLQITLLEVIEEKTHGNLNGNEQKILSQALHETRMAYVRALDEEKAEREAAASKKAEGAGDEKKPGSDAAEEAGAAGEDEESASETKEGEEKPESPGNN